MKHIKVSPDSEQAYIITWKHKTSRKLSFLIIKSIPHPKNSVIREKTLSVD